MRGMLIGSVMGLVALVFGPSELAAEGALAVGTTGNVAVDGVAIGGSYNKATKDQAIAAALAVCRSQPGIEKSVARCAIVGTFAGQCYAVAFDPKTGTPGAGWAIGANRQAAEKQAMANCRATAGADRRQFCSITNIVACDTHS